MLHLVVPQNTYKQHVEIWAEPYEDGVAVTAKNKDSESILFIIKSDGTVERWSHVDPDLGFKLDAGGCVTIKD